MTAKDKRNIDTAATQIEDGLTILAALLADMVTGDDGNRSQDVLDSSEELEGVGPSVSSEINQSPVSEPPSETTSDHPVSE